MHSVLQYSVSCSFDTRGLGIQNVKWASLTSDISRNREEKCGHFYCRWITGGHKSLNWPWAHSRCVVYLQCDTALGSAGRSYEGYRPHLPLCRFLCLTVSMLPSSVPWLYQCVSSLYHSVSSLTRKWLCHLSRCWSSFVFRFSKCEVNWLNYFNARIYSF